MKIVNSISDNKIIYRQVAEKKAKRLEEEVKALHSLLQEKDRQLQTVASSNAQVEALFFLFLLFFCHISSFTIE